MGNLEHPLLIVDWVNAALGPIVAPLLGLFGVHHDPASEHPLIPNYMVMTMLIVLGFAVLGLILKSRLSVENPSKLQIVLEDLVSGLVGLIEEWLGPNGRRYLPLLGALGGFILVSNYIGLVPGFMAPTSNINVTVGCALTTWVFYHLQGIRTQGLVAYVLHFAFPPGAPKALAPLMLPIELISHMARLLSLSLRLFGNIFGEEMVIAILAFLVPYFVPLPIMLLGLITGGLQAFVFVLLSIIYLQGATHIEHEDHAHEHDAAHTHGDKRGAGELAAA